MSYSVIATPDFVKELKPLAKKYPSLKNELYELSESLSTNPRQGESLGLDSYKIRLAIQSKGKGKSGGGRIITHVVVEETRVYIISIYDKSSQSSISKDEIKQRIKAIKK
ncbi:MAG: addiction module toxin RelE [Chitinophagales bacterium]|nr:addiction module toxin RelE [Chitinophagales bacterium]